MNQEPHIDVLPVAQPLNTSASLSINVKKTNTCYMSSLAPITGSKIRTSKTKNVVEPKLRSEKSNCETNSRGTHSALKFPAVR